ncbi:MAG TPA: DUF2252 domain-containing protein [Streptosporangiaceae bacterium]|nr:DUF2252 domain-containing protein [Streptosporangiaceae bacterium]
MPAPAAKSATRTTARSRHPRRAAPARASRAGSTRTRIARPSVDRLDPAERVARGKAARAAVPRESQAALSPADGRPDPVSLLEGQAASRVAGLVPIRYGRMLASPFGFYRGAALVMARDLAATPASGLTVQACGDAHLSNFGFFASPERRLVFDVNDFDETLPAPWEWDVKRLAASLEVAARDNGFGLKKRRDIVLTAVGSYRTAMREFAGQGNLEVWFTQEDLDQLRRRYESQLARPARRKVARSAARAPERNSLRELDRLCTLVDGRPRIAADPPLIVPIADLVSDQVETGELAAAMSVLISRYRQTLQDDRRLLIRQYQFADMARKVVGVGSVGTRCWAILLLGRDALDPLFLQVKEAEPSVLAQFAGASEYDNQGQRVVAGQRLMQAASDIFLGWQRVSGPDGQSRDFYVRSLRDWKLSADYTEMVPRGMRTYGALCGWTLARAHARSGDRIAIGAYLGAKPVFDHAVAEFAASYADQNEKDFQLLEAAEKSGRITTVRDV